MEGVLFGKDIIDSIVARSHISRRAVLWSWIERNNANQELKDYNPNREVNMAKGKRKTTLAERAEITKHCISCGKDYKSTAVLYDVLYHQVYTWV